jgi:hypothetical protein
MQGSETEALKLPAGKHRIKVEVEADGYNQSNTIQANLTHDQPQLLEIRCDKQDLGLTLK